MKKLLSLIFCIVATLTSHAQAGYDFSATNSNGYTLYYKILDPIRKRVEIVNAPGAMGMWGGYSFSGPFDVPAQVENGGVTYNVVSIDVFMMLGVGHGSITTLTLHEGLETIGYTTFWQFNVGNSELVIPSTVTSYGGGAFYQTVWTAPALTVRLLNPVPASGYTGCPAFSINGGGAYGTTPSTFKIIVPTDVTHAYCNETTPYGTGGYSWSSYADYYREEVKIGTSGYATLYLETENFEVPAGCTAYVITEVKKESGQYQAKTEAFAAGSIIPAGQAVILKGTAGQTYEYKANLTGTPVTIAKNLLVGTATEQTLNAAGYKYFLFGSGPDGQGFYRQTGHDINSVHLKAHKAGLRLPSTAIGSAKSFVIDFSTPETTGIRSVGSAVQPSKEDVYFDLQGRRVLHPTRGIYIVNGKKIVKE